MRMFICTRSVKLERGRVLSVDVGLPRSACRPHSQETETRMWIEGWGVEGCWGVGVLLDSACSGMRGRERGVVGL